MLTVHLSFCPHSMLSSIIILYDQDSVAWLYILNISKTLLNIHGTINDVSHIIQWVSITWVTLVKFGVLIAVIIVTLLEEAQLIIEEWNIRDTNSKVFQTSERRDTLTIFPVFL